MDIKEYLKKFFAAQYSDNSSSEEENLSEYINHVLSTCSHLSSKDFHPDKDKIWNNIQNEIKYKKRNSWKTLSIATAAIITLLLGMSLLLDFYVQQNEDVQQMFASTPSIEPVKIVLDNGEIIFPNTIANDTVISTAGGNIVLNNAENLKYEKLEEDAFELVYNTLIVPKEKNYYFILSDGTEVWLNSDSKLRFPVNFQGEERKVFLEGEGYFQVTADKNKPFRVELEKGVVEVLGTSFNIYSYADREESTTTLVSGKIKFIRNSDEMEWILNPGKQLTLTENNVNIEKVNTTEIISWRDGRFIFNNKSLEDIFFQLEKWFNVSVVFAEEDFKCYKITGVADKNAGIENILEVLEEITPFNYKKENNDILITSKNKKKNQKK